MICYRDMTFCNAECANKDCARKFTDDDKQKAIKWWGNENVPVAFSDFSSNCKEFKEITHE